MVKKQLVKCMFHQCSLDAELTLNACVSALWEHVRWHSGQHIVSHSPLWIPPEAATVIYGAELGNAPLEELDSAHSHLEILWPCIWICLGLRTATKITENINAWSKQVLSYQSAELAAQNCNSLHSWLCQRVCLSFTLLRSTWTYGMHTCHS